MPRFLLDEEKKKKASAPSSSLNGNWAKTIQLRRAPLILHNLIQQFITNLSNRPQLNNYLNSRRHLQLVDVHSTRLY